ncbi:Abhydrolase domain-containing protein C57A10.08c [Ceratocystis fimbriata CBS 114723]|uniref:Abhydrolase domain-containing protein C57A10.08c n=1 Tax=Ceratocystis fimbriata CBS 114723 TaxID=1035309 RepID=A0A2C5X242_9PEZI|nr:Abhydrolase domain-containing protein C57A10.08c [Ceratocystis fimbriata CBS 114723]
MTAPSSSLDDADLSDPQLLRENTHFRSYTIGKFSYSNLRIFYRRHPALAPESTSPLIVCIHGLGGSVAQYASLLPHLTPLSSILIIDLPGCGRSAFTETRWEAYTPATLSLLLEAIITDFRGAHRPLVLIGHSMGTALGARLANPMHSSLAPDVAALVALCPVAESANPEKTALLRRLLWIPEWLFNLWRIWDRRGGAQSESVYRFVGKEAPEDLRRMQYRFNAQSRTPVWRRMAWGVLPDGHDERGEGIGGLSGKDLWAGVDAPVLLVGGEDDKVTLAEEVFKAAAAIRSKDGSGSRVVKTCILPSPASHTLLYDPRTVPKVFAIIKTFLRENVNGLRDDCLVSE